MTWLPFTVGIVYAIVLAALILSVAYQASSSAIFGTAGHTSSEFKAVVAVLVMASMFWTVGGLTGTTAGLTGSWLAVGMAVAGYCISRAFVKTKK